MFLVSFRSFAFFIDSLGESIVICKLLDFVLGFEIGFSGNTTVIFGLGIVFTELMIGSFNF